MPLFDCSRSALLVTFTSTRGCYKYITNALFAHTTHPADSGLTLFVYQSQLALRVCRVHGRRVGRQPGDFADGV